MSEQIETFQQNFRNVVENTAYLLDDAKFKQEHGFSFTEYITKGNSSILPGLKSVSISFGFAYQTYPKTLIVF